MRCNSTREITLTKFHTIETDSMIIVFKKKPVIFDKGTDTKFQYLKIHYFMLLHTTTRKSFKTAHIE